MTLRKSALLASFLILTTGSCTTIEVAPILPCPERPTLEALPDDLQLRIPEDALLIIGRNQLAMKAYAKKIEARAGCAS